MESSESSSEIGSSSCPADRLRRLHISGAVKQEEPFPESTSGSVAGWMNFEDVTLRNPDKPSDLEDLLLSSSGAWTLTHAGLQHAVRLCRLIMESDITVDTLANAVEVTKGTTMHVIKQAIRAAIAEGVTIYLTEWSDEKLDAFHIPQPLSTKGIVNANIFLRRQDVQDFLPHSGTIESWTREDRQGIIAMTWWIVHEMAHMIGTVLARKGSILTHQTPPSATAWHAVRYSTVIYSAEVEPQFFGERGYFLESHIGGIVHCVMKSRKITELWFKTNPSFKLTMLHEEDQDKFLQLDGSHNFTGLGMTTSVHKAVMTEDKFKCRRCTEANLLGRISDFPGRPYHPGIKY